MAKGKGMALGKGLGAILEEVGQAYDSELAGTPELANREGEGGVVEIDTALIDPNPYQPRKHFDEERLRELADSIKGHGLLQPVVLVPHGERYILVAGERRLRAHALAGLDIIKSIIADVDFDEIRLRELALIENIQRENLNAIELANSYQELITVHQITHEELSKVVHKSRSQITNTLRLLALSPYVQEKIAEEKITQGHAKILVGLDEEKQRVLTDTIIGQKLSVRDAENLIQEKKSPASSAKKSKPSSLKVTSDQKEEIKALLPFKHKIKSNSIEIVLPNEDELIKLITFLQNK